MSVISTKDFKISQISAIETYAVRHPVLRAGQPVETCAFSGDNLTTTIHLGAYNKHKLFGVASFIKINNNRFTNTLQYQLRGMAILEEFQGKGFGKRLLTFGENLLKNENTQLVWCNARSIAVKFYEHKGYKIIGDVFDIPKIGPHYLMYKTLL